MEGAEARHGAPCRSRSSGPVSPPPLPIIVLEEFAPGSTTEMISAPRSPSGCVQALVGAGAEAVEGNAEAGYFYFGHEGLILNHKVKCPALCVETALRAAMSLGLLHAPLSS